MNVHNVFVSSANKGTRVYERDNHSTRKEMAIQQKCSLFSLRAGAHNQTLHHSLSQKWRLLLWLAQPVACMYCMTARCACAGTYNALLLFMFWFLPSHLALHSCIHDAMEQLSRLYELPWIVNGCAWRGVNVCFCMYVVCTQTYERSVVDGNRVNEFPLVFLSHSSCSPYIQIRIQNRFLRFQCFR